MRSSNHRLESDARQNSRGSPGTSGVCGTRGNQVNDETKLAITAVATVVLTPVSILVFYIDYEVLSYSTPLALRRFNAWPWFRASILLTTLSSLFPFFLLWTSKGRRSVLDYEIGAYAFAGVSIAALFIYPGTEALGVDSDPNVFWVISLMCLLHLFHAKVFGEYAWRHAPWRGPEA